MNIPDSLHPSLRLSDTNQNDFQEEAKEIIQSDDLAPIVNILSLLCHEGVTLCTGCKSQKLRAQSICLHCMENYPNAFTLKLSQIIKSDPQPTIRNRCATTLYSLLLEMKVSSHSLSPTVIAEIKPILLSCLKQECYSEEVFMMVSKIVSLVTSQLFDYDLEWTELIDYITLIIHIPLEYRKGLWIFRDLPLNWSVKSFISYRDTVVSGVSSHLDSWGDRGYDVWVLAFTTSVTCMLHLTGSKMEACSLEDRIMESVNRIVGEGAEIFLKIGLEYLTMFIVKQAKHISFQIYRMIVDLVMKITHVFGISEQTILAAEDVVTALTEV